MTTTRTATIVLLMLLAVLGSGVGTSAAGETFTAPYEALGVWTPPYRAGIVICPQDPDGSHCGFRIDPLPPTDLGRSIGQPDLRSPSSWDTVVLDAEDVMAWFYTPIQGCMGASASHCQDGCGPLTYTPPPHATGPLKAFVHAVRVTYDLEFCAGSTGTLSGTFT